eukprot:1702550-Prymnesium_polylepis.1
MSSSSIGDELIMSSSSIGGELMMSSFSIVPGALGDVGAARVSRARGGLRAGYSSGRVGSLWHAPMCMLTRDGEAHGRPGSSAGAEMLCGGHAERAVLFIDRSGLEGGVPPLTPCSLAMRRCR